MEEHEQFYQDLVNQVKGYDGEKADIVSLAPALFKFLTGVAGDDGIPKKGRSLAEGAIGYFIAPYDGLPEEALGPLGYMDDIYASLHVIRKLEGIVQEEVLESHWLGEGSLVSVVDRVYPQVEAYLRDHAAHILNYVEFLIRSS